MIVPHDDFLIALRKGRGSARDLIAVYEIYPHDYVPVGIGSFSPFDPRDAIRRFSSVSFSTTYNGDDVVYDRVALGGVSIKKRITKQLDTCSITLSNVKKDDDGRRMLARFILTVDIQGMILVVRWLSRSVTNTIDKSMIQFIGKIDKPDDVDREKGTISAKQYFGRTEAQVPPGIYQPSCILKFKGPGCLGTEVLSQKTPTYQAAKVCNKTEAQCIAYSNREFFQGLSILTLTSSFIYRPHRGLFTRIINIAIPISIPIYNALRRKTTVGNSIHDGTPYGQPIPLMLGRVWKKLTPLQYQDTGEQIYAKLAAGRGPISDFVFLKQEAPNFSQPLSVTKHLGEFGGVGTQTADTVFPDASFHSKIAYVTLGCSGSNIETEDPAPEISSLIAGQKIFHAFGANFDGTATLNNEFAGFNELNRAASASDNPVDQTFWLLNDSEMLNIPREMIWEKGSARTSAYTLGPIKDVTNAERVILPNNQIGKAGVDYKRWNSTGIIGRRNYDAAFRPCGVMNREAEYEYYDESAPPSSLDVKPIYRKRYSCNVEISDATKILDFLHDVLLPTFRGYLKHDQWGRIWVDNKRPADHTFMRVASIVGATSIKVKDVLPWRRLEPLLTDFPPPLTGKLLIGANLPTSEVRSITSVDYSADGDAITLDADGTGNIVLVGVSGATLSGGSASAPSTGYAGFQATPPSVQPGDTASITIDGVTVTVTANQENVVGLITIDYGIREIVEQLAYAVNAEPLLQDYVVASTASASAIEWRVVITSKYGVLNLSSPPLEEPHLTELPDPDTAPSASTSAGTLAAGTWLLSYAWRNANGNTLDSPLFPVTFTGTKQITVDAVVPPAGADSVDWFLSVEANSDIQVLVNNNDGSSFSINANPDPQAVLTPLRNTTGEEVIRVMKSLAGKALTYADTTKGNIIDGSFKWPQGSRQSTVNQVKAEYYEAIRDFAKQPIVVNDERHQERVGGLPNSINLDLRGVDNFNQAKRLCNAALAELRDLDYFFEFASGEGDSLLLQVGDVVCASDDSGEWRNQLMMIEEPTFSDKFIGSFACRKYATSAYDDAVEETQVPLSSGLDNWMGPAPCPEFNTADFPPDGLVKTTDGVSGVTVVEGGVIFGNSVYGQIVTVSLKRPLSSIWEIIATNLIPDENSEASFSFEAVEAGLYTVKLTATSQFGVPNTTCEPEAIIAVGLGTAQGDWHTPMIQMSGEGGLYTEGEGSWSIPMETMVGEGELQPFGGGTWDIPMGGISPIDSPSDLADIWEWWEPSREAFSDNDQIGTLTGQFAPGSGHNFEQSTGSKKPIYKESIINGHGVMRFDGTDDEMTGANPNGLTEVHFFVVIKIDNDPPATNKNGLWSFGPATLNLYPSLSDTSKIVIGDFINASVTAFSKSGIDLAQWRVYEVVSTASTWKMLLDGTLLNTLGGIVGHQSNGFNPIGRSGVFDPNFLDGDLAGIYICSAELGAGDRTKMINYLNDRFALSAS